VTTRAETTSLAAGDARVRVFVRRVLSIAAVHRVVV
jgi:hypothetical protein